MCLLASHNPRTTRVAVVHHSPPPIPPLPSVTRLLRAATFERILALKFGQLQTSFSPVGLGHPVRIELGSSPDPISEKNSNQLLALKYKYAQFSAHPAFPPHFPPPYCPSFTPYFPFLLYPPFPLSSPQGFYQ